jgi:hypothetical protein
MYFFTSLRSLCNIKYLHGHVYKFIKLVASRYIDAPPSSLMDSNVSPKVKTTEGERVGECSLPHNISEVEWCARALRWGLRRLTSNSITHTDMHKPNCKLVSA